MKKFWLIGFTLLILTGCSGPLYSWGNYDSELYKYYKDPGHEEKFIGEMEKHVANLEKKNKTVAPGLYAEIGTIYLKQNNKSQARRYYQKEHDAWPESRKLMSSLIKKIDGKTS